MSAGLLLQEFAKIIERPNSIPSLRRFLVDLAVSGRLGRTGEWPCAPLGDTIELKYGKGLAPADRTSVGPVGVYGSNGIVARTHTAMTTRPAIIVGRKGSAGALRIAEEPSWTTDVAYYVEPPPSFDIRFLFFALQSLRLESLGKGVKPGLSRSDAYPLPLPRPSLTDQQRIVAKLDELLVLCDQLEAAQNDREARRDLLRTTSLRNVAASVESKSDTRFFLSNSSRMISRPEHVVGVRQAILDLATRGRLAPQDPRDGPASELVASDGAPGAENGLPSGWTRVQMRRLTALVTSGSRGWGEYYSSTGAKFIRAQNIRFGHLLLENLAHVTVPRRSEGKRTRVQAGDLLVVITGAGVTNPALLQIELGEAYVSQHVGLVRLANKDLGPWVLLCLMAPAGARDELVARAYGSGKPGLNLDNIRTLEVPLPPLPEQRRIVAKVNELMAVCDELEQSLATEQRERSRLLEALLDNALRVGPRESELAAV